VTQLERALVAMGLTLAVGPVVLAVLRRLQVLDHPCERSSHAAPVPRGGGVAPALGAVAAVALTPPLEGSHLGGVTLAAVMFGLVGLLEDLLGIRALRRLAIQFVVSALASVVLLQHLSGPALWQGIFAAGVVFWIVAFVNAYNFMDGIDGISVGQATGAGATWFLVGTVTDSPVLASGGAVIAGVALGFAPYNLPVARMFLGDVGSYFIGAWLAAVAVLGLRAGVPPEAVLAPLVLYVADTGTTLVRRVVRGERWHAPHRSHAYQRLGDAGWSHVQASAFVAACIAACSALGAVSLSGSALARVTADVALAGVIGGYLLAPRLATRARSAVAVA